MSVPFRPLWDWPRPGREVGGLTIAQGDARMRPRPSIEEYALTLAIAAASRSEDPKRKVGACVIGHFGEVIALGYNGPPSGIDLTKSEWEDREFVRLVTVHAEANALRYVRPGEAAMLASTYQPCADCLKLARAQGIFDVIFATPSSDRWRTDSERVAERLGMNVRRMGVSTYLR